MPQRDEIQMESLNESLTIYSLKVFSFFLLRSPLLKKTLLYGSKHISDIIPFNNTLIFDSKGIFWLTFAV